MSLLSNIFKISGNRANEVFGVDIGSSSIKVVELENKKGILTLRTYGEIQIGPYLKKDIGETATLDVGSEKQALADILRDASVTAKSAVFAMPLSSSFVTNVTIANNPEADLGALVRVEARKVIPASLSEITLDWAEVDFTTDDDKETRKKKKKTPATDRKVLIAAIQNVALERFKSLMHSSGVENPPTEIECFSALRAIYRNDEVDTAVIDIGAVSTKLYIIHNGVLLRMHRIRAGGAMATNRIASVLNIPFEEAEVKKHFATSKDHDYNDIKRAHDASYERGWREFAQVIREYEQQNSVNISSIHVSGGGALFSGIEATIRQALNKPTSIVNPFSKVSYPVFIEDAVKEIGPSFAVALGAALRHFE